MYRTLKVRLKRKLYFDIFDRGHRKKLTYKEIDCLSNLSHKYKKYITNTEKLNGEELGVEYMFSDKNVQFEEILAELLPLNKRMDVWMYSDVQWEKQDFDEAAAYIFSFNKRCPEYEDEKYGHREINCSTCWCRDIREKVYAKPIASLRRTFESNKTGASIEESEVHVLSDSLYEYLIENGIDKTCFQPVFDKKNQEWAKMLSGRDHILPSLSIYHEHYDIVDVCGNCGKKMIKSSYRKISNSLWYEFEEGRSFGYYPCSERWLIKKEIADNMSDVNLTEDYYISEQLLVISKKLFDLIYENNPKIRKVSTPIFAAPFSLNENNGELVMSQE